MSLNSCLRLFLILHVWLQLEEKQIPYRIEKINMRCYGDKEPSYLEKTRSGLLPAIELNGRFITESEVIMFTVRWKPLIYGVLTDIPVFCV